MAYKLLIVVTAFSGAIAFGWLIWRAVEFVLSPRDDDPADMEEAFGDVPNTTDLADAHSQIHGGP